MKVTIAMDSFKGSLTAVQACSAVQKGFSVLPDATFRAVPMADGGEGTVACMAVACGKDILYETVPDLFGREKSCGYVTPDGGDTVVLEMAMAAGIADLPREERDVLRASTFGVGVQLRNALARGCKKIILGLGGSATSDCALGALQALGVVFYGADGVRIPDGAGGGMLHRIVSADPSGMVSVEGVEIFYACDVTNPLFGPDGAAYVYAPQKGADPATVASLDEGLQCFSRVLCDTFGRDISRVPGAGAAGGLCGGLLCVLGGTVRSGFDLLSDAAGLETLISESDLVITGEGKTDAQTAFGKLPCKIGELGKKHGVPVICISGSVDRSAAELYAHGITALFDTVPSPMTLSDAMERAEASLCFTSENAARVIGSFGK